MRTMYDAVTASNIPRTAVMVAGYIDKIKLEPWSAADWARFPSAVKVTIVKKASTNAGHVLDVEPGDARPDEAPGWVRMRRAAGADPTIYMNLSTWPTVRAAFQSAGVAEPHYWVAKYDGVDKIPADWLAKGCVAKQYGGDVPGGYDLNIVVDHWPGVDSAGQEAPDMDSNQDQLLRELHLYVSGSGSPQYPGAGTVALTTQVANLGKSLTDLTALVRQGSSVTPEQLAAAILPPLLDQAKTSLADVADLNEEQVATKLADILHERLAS